MRYWRLRVEDPPFVGVGRNELCPCGSGLKFKRCHAPRKGRCRTVTFDFGRTLSPEDLNEVLVLPHGAVQVRRFGLPLIPIAAETQETYDRPKGPKVLYRFPGATFQAGTNPNVLLEKYQHVFAIDTNSASSQMGDLSVVAVVGCRFTQTDHKLLAEPFLVGTWHNKGSAVPEKSAWRMFLELLIAHLAVSDRERIALIVDHDLENLDAYNGRAKAIYEGFMLPANVDLIYASDSATGFVGCCLVRMCHQEAKKELRHQLRDLSNGAQPAA